MDESSRKALKRLEPLVGEWTLEAMSPDRTPWPGRARATIEWHASKAHLVERWSVEDEPRSGVSIMGCDDSNNTYVRLHYDERGVCRIYDMAISDHEWKLWRNGDPFPQRFTATISPDRNTITGRWEKATDGETWEADLDLIYRRAT